MHGLPRYGGATQEMRPDDTWRVPHSRYDLLIHFPPQMHVLGHAVAYSTDEAVGRSYMCSILEQPRLNSSKKAIYINDVNAIGWSSAKSSSKAPGFNFEFRESGGSRS